MLFTSLCSDPLFLPSSHLSHQLNSFPLYEETASEAEIDRQADRHKPYTQLHLVVFSLNENINHGCYHFLSAAV